MVGDTSLATRTEVLETIRDRYAEASKRDKSRMLDEFVALSGSPRKHAVRHLNQHGQMKPYAQGCQTQCPLRKYTLTWLKRWMVP